MRSDTRDVGLIGTTILQCPKFMVTFTGTFERCQCVQLSSQTKRISPRVTPYIACIRPLTSNS